MLSVRKRRRGLLAALSKYQRMSTFLSASAAELLALRALFPNAELYFTYGQTELGPRVSTLHVDPRTLSQEGPVTLGRGGEQRCRVGVMGFGHGAAGTGERLVLSADAT